MAKIVCSVSTKNRKNRFAMQSKRYMLTPVFGEVRFAHLFSFLWCAAFL